MRLAVILNGNLAIDLSGLNNIAAENARNLRDIMIGIYRGIFAFCGLMAVYGFVRECLRFYKYLRLRKV